MKVLVVSAGPDFSVQDVFAGLTEALDRQCTVARMNLNDRLAFYSAAHLEREGEFIHAFDFDASCHMAMAGVEAACFEFQPDAVVFVSGFFLSERKCDLLRRRGVKVVIVHTESPYEDDKQVERASWADVNIVNDPTNLERFPKGTVYLPHSYRPEVHHPNGRDEWWEFSFVGTGYPSRVEFFEKVDFGGLSVALRGNWSHLADDSPLQQFVEDPDECLINVETADLYRHSETSVNLYRRESSDGETGDGWAVGPREVELAACGTWFARDPRGESDLLFPMLPSFSDPCELGDLLRWAIANPDKRHVAADQARAAVADRTFDSYASSLLYLINKE